MRHAMVEFPGRSSQDKNNAKPSLPGLFSPPRFAVTFSVWVERITRSCLRSCVNCLASHSSAYKECLFPFGQSKVVYRILCKGQDRTARILSMFRKTIIESIAIQLNVYLREARHPLAIVAPLSGLSTFSKCYIVIIVPIRYAFMIEGLSCS